MSAFGTSYEDRLKDHYTGVRARLDGLMPPPPKAPRPKPLSPFNPRRILAEKLAVDPWRMPPAVPYDDALTVFVPGPPQSKTILRDVARKHKVAVREIVGEGRSRYVILARHEAMYRLRDEMQLSWLQIGRLIGGKDHTTVLHGYRMHKERMGG